MRRANKWIDDSGNTYEVDDPDERGWSWLTITDGSDASDTIKVPPGGLEALLYILSEQRNSK